MSSLTIIYGNSLTKLVAFDKSMGLNVITMDVGGNGTYLNIYLDKLYI